MAEIARLPHVERVSVDAVVTAYEVGQAVRVAATGRAGTHAQGAGIVVAVIDTGIDRHHPALAGKVIGGYDFVNDDADPMDDHRHGTHVAGIIAASGGPMRGVAPGVSLLAYKVLDANGRGNVSDIVAAIERALADGADVMNLSLGAGGHPDDPMSRAVENAVAAGAVVCVAAGNAGRFHTIGSPGVAHSAITVGATNDEGLIAEFSSRGPAGRSGAIKPDLVAPGVEVLSTVLNGEYAVATGTSMATPYVAGLVALLREAHPDWTPARVKSALVSSAVPVANEEVMTQGTGRANLQRANASDVVVAPTHVNFGLDGTLAPVWSSTRTLSLRNASAVQRTIRLSAERVRVMPSEVVIPAGETREVEVAIEVVHEELGEVPDSFTFGGVIALEWAGGDARVPWAFVRAGRSIVTHPGALPDVYWGHGNRRGSVAIEPEAAEALVEPGVYDIAAIGARDGDVRIYVAEQQRIEGESLLALTPELAAHEVRLDGVDGQGMPLAEPLARVRLLLPDGPGIVLPPMSGRTLHATPFSDRFAIYALESGFDAESRTLHIVQHPLLRGLSASTALRNSPADFRAQELRIRFHDTAERTIVLMPRDYPRNGMDFGRIPSTFRAQSGGDSWTATILMTPELADAAFAGALQLSVNDQPPTLVAPMLRRDGQGFFTARGFARPLVPTGLAEGEVLELGNEPLHPSMRVDALDNSFGGEFDVRGSHGESRRDVTATFRVTDSDDQQVATGNVMFGGFGAQLPGRGAYRAELRAGDATMTLQFDTTHGNATLPSLTSLAVLDGAGRHTARLPHNGNGSLIFSTSDSAPGVAFRRRGALTWVQLTPVQIGEDATYRFVHRVDLADAIRIGGAIEVAIELRGEDETTATWIAPLFTTVSEGDGTKRRAARK